MTSVWKNVWARIIRYPMPLVALICSANTSSSQAMAVARRSPTRKPGSAPGRTTRRIGPAARQPDGAASSRSPRVEALDGRAGVDVDREGHAEHDQRDLHRLADAQPHHQQRLEGDDRHEAEHLHVGVDEVVAEPREPGDQGQQLPMGTPIAMPHSTRWSDAHSGSAACRRASEVGPATHVDGPGQAVGEIHPMGGELPDAEQQHHHAEEPLDAARDAPAARGARSATNSSAVRRSTRRTCSVTARARPTADPSTTVIRNAPPSRATERKPSGPPRARRRVTVMRCSVRGSHPRRRRAPPGGRWPGCPRRRCSRAPTVNRTEVARASRPGRRGTLEQGPALACSRSPTTWLVKLRFTNSAFAPDSGCTRTTGCSVQYGDDVEGRARSASALAAAQLHEDLVPVHRVQPGDQLPDRPGQALVGRDQVGPRGVAALRRGTSTARRIDPSGGLCTKVTSVCQLFSWRHPRHRRRHRRSGRSSPSRR